MRFIYSWRWFGPNDRITLQQISQTGAEGIVTALHQIPVGDIWTVEAINERKRFIENAGLKWVVVESLPVSEDIKRWSGNFSDHIENYKSSVRNLAECGIKTICYNFMPVLDWSRTNLRLTLKNNSYTSGFELYIFAAFDIFILQRPEARKDYSPEIVQKATEYIHKLDVHQKNNLQDTILYGLPGSMDTYTIDQFRNMLNSYRQIDRKGLKHHLNKFLNHIIPVAEECDIKMAVHPDDPPWNLLGLPRIVSSIDDLRDIIAMVDSPSNGITLCSGSLGAGHFNNIVNIAEVLTPKVHFLHLRNLIRDSGLNFEEKQFFDGDIDMIEVTKAIIRSGLKHETETGKEVFLPVRPDHGHQILGDIDKENYPGYSLYGRLKNLAEIKGLTMGLLNIYTGD